MRAILVGFGRRGRALFPILLSTPDVQLVGIADRCPEARALAQSQTGLPVFSPWETTWPVPSPELVILATPAGGRVELVAALARPGVRGILAEKPLAFSLSAVDRMLLDCDQESIALGVFQHWRECPALGKLRAAIAANELGEIQTLHGVGYGNLLDQGWHLLDAARWLLGGAEVARAQASGCNDPQTLAQFSGDDAPVEFDPAHPAPIWTQADLAFANGARMRLDCGPLIPRTNAPLGVWHERRLSLVGADGTAEVRPGHYLKVCTRTSGVQVWHFDPSCLETATQRVIQGFCESLRSDTPVPSPAADARHTVAGLVLCGRSLKSGSIAIGPARPDEEPFRQSQAANESTADRSQPQHTGPEYSILIPLQCDREFLPQCLAGWLQQEQIAPADYELIWLDATAGHEHLGVIRPQLRPQDRVVRELDANRSRLYDLGARAARGRYVLFTESHCRPEPRFLSELTRYFESHAVAGACCRTIPITPSALARADAAVHMAGFDQLHRGSDWRKFIIHGVALRRDVYLAVGGLQSQYELYAEMILAADLRDAGHRLGYAPDCAVHHLYRSSIFELQEEIKYVRGELLYRRDHGSVARIGFSYIEMCDDVLESNAARRDALQREWKRLTPQLRRGRLQAWRSIAALSLDVLRNSRAGGWLSRVAWWSAAARCWLNRCSDRRMAAAFRDLLLATYRCAWHRYQPALGSRPAADATGKLTADRFESGATFGLHALERFGGRVFRWTRSVAGLRLALSPGQYCVEIDVGAIRPWPVAIDWTLDGERIDLRDVEIDGEICRLTISLPASGDGRSHTLGIACEPWDAPDERELGLPIFAVHCRRLETIEDAEPTLLPFPSRIETRGAVSRAA